MCIFMRASIFAIKTKFQCSINKIMLQAKGSACEVDLGCELSALDATQSSDSIDTCSFLHIALYMMI